MFYLYKNHLQTRKQLRLKTEPKQHFLDSSPEQVLDSEFVQYIQSSDLNKMNPFDRVPVNLVNIEIQRNRKQIKKARYRCLRSQWKKHHVRFVWSITNQVEILFMLIVRN